MAINPLLFLASMPDPGQAFMQSFQAARQQRDAQDQKAQQKQLFAQMSEQVRKDPSPQNLAQFAMAFPQMAEAIQAAYKPMTEERRAREVAFYGQTLGALQRGNTKAARELVENRLAAARNTPGEEETVKKLELGLEQFNTDPDSLKAGLAFEVQQLDSKLYDTLYAEKNNQTAFQQDYQFIKNTFGADAAAEFAQFGRSGVVSIPLGEGKGTYVGPASMAPGAARWQQATPQGTAPAPTPQGATPTPLAETAIPGMLANASKSKTITQAEANVVKQSLGPKGQGKFQQWLKDEGIRVIVRTGMFNGKRVVQYEDGTIE